MSSSNIKIKCTLIVAAAGFGKRMGISVPKQFLNYKNKPLLINILEVGEKSTLVEKIIVVAGKELEKKVSDLCEYYKLNKVKKIVIGGKNRQESVFNALKFCSKDDIIAVQDGVRPFFKEKYLEQTLIELEENKNIFGVVIGVPVKDTVKKVDGNNLIESTPKRSKLFLAQTPQVFRGEILINSYENAIKDKFLGTDDSSLVEKYYGRVKIIEGDYSNIKITTKEDLKFLD